MRRGSALVRVGGSVRGDDDGAPRFADWAMLARCHRSRGRRRCSEARLGASAARTRRRLADERDFARSALGGAAGGGVGVALAGRWLQPLRRERIGGQGAAEEVALQLLAAGGAEEVALGGGFHAFGQQG